MYGVPKACSCTLHVKCARLLHAQAARRVHDRSERGAGGLDVFDVDEGRGHGGGVTTVGLVAPGDNATIVRERGERHVVRVELGDATAARDLHGIVGEHRCESKVRRLERRRGGDLRAVLVAAVVLRPPRVDVAIVREHCKGALVGQHGFDATRLRDALELGVIDRREARLVCRPRNERRQILRAQLPTLHRLSRIRLVVGAQVELGDEGKVRCVQLSRTQTRASTSWLAVAFGHGGVVVKVGITLPRPRRHAAVGGAAPSRHAAVGEHGAEGRAGTRHLHDVGRVGERTASPAGAAVPRVAPCDAEAKRAQQLLLLGVGQVAEARCLEGVLVVGVLLHEGAAEDVAAVDLGLELRRQVQAGAAVLAVAEAREGAAGLVLQARLVGRVLGALHLRVLVVVVAPEGVELVVSSPRRAAGARWPRLARGEEGKLGVVDRGDARGAEARDVVWHLTARSLGPPRPEGAVPLARNEGDVVAVEGDGAPQIEGLRDVTAPLAGWYTIRRVAAEGGISPGDHRAVALDRGEGLAGRLDAAHAHQARLRAWRHLAARIGQAPRRHGAVVLDGGEGKLVRDHVDRAVLPIVDGDPSAAGSTPRDSEQHRRWR
eukprot:scaffold94526_cov63-Phaeocystis_antarctica.AAC.6